MNPTINTHPTFKESLVVIAVTIPLVIISAPALVVDSAINWWRNKK